ncbi:MAG: glycerate kinase [Campylobacterales bacterium]
MQLREAAREIWEAGVEAAKPAEVMRRALRVENGTLYVEGKPLPGKRLFVFGAGKASLSMAQEAERILGDRIEGGLIVSNVPGSLQRIAVATGRHPVPDETSIQAAKALIKAMQEAGSEDACLFLLSGGASALMELPAEGIGFKQMQQAFRALIASGAPIEAVNCVRKHLSQVKGGQLARFIKARTAVLVISDVIGDDLEAIGSAPLYRDATTYADALAIVDRYRVQLPAAVSAHLICGASGEVSETPKQPASHVSHHLIGTNVRALDAMARRARELGFAPAVLTDRLEGEAREAARVLISVARGQRFCDRPAALLFGGETTVTLRGTGEGGRNQEMVLAALSELGGDGSICLLSAGSDGIDGNSPAAGAIADEMSWRGALEMDLDPNAFLENNDSYRFFKAAGGLLAPGATGTNVMDLGVILIKEKK